MAESMDIISEIKRQLGSMTASQLKIANGILMDPALCLFSSIEQVAKQLDVSTATIVRFAKMLGMRGYSQLQDRMRDHYWQHLEPVTRLNSPDSEQYTAENSFKSIYQRQMKVLENMYTPELEDRLRQATKVLHMTGHIYTIGARGSYACTHYIGHHLNRILGNCDILEENARLCDQLLHIKAGDVVFVINQPRYSKRLLAAIQVAKTMQAKIIAISDSNLSPYRKLADVFFAVPNQSGDFHNSLMASMMIAEILITAIATFDKSISQESLQRMEYIFKEMDVFI